MCSNSTLCDLNSAEYEAAIVRLRELHEPCRKLIERFDLQGDLVRKHRMEFINAILEGERKIDPKSMPRMERTIRKAIAEALALNHVAAPLIDLAKQLNNVVLPPGFKLTTPPIKDRWACVKGLEIMPLALVEDDGQASAANARKCKCNEEVSWSTTATNVASNERTPPPHTCLEVACHYGIIRLSSHASQELRKLGFRVDPEFTPIFTHTAYIQVIAAYESDRSGITTRQGVDEQTPPLRLLVPREYPQDGETVQLYYDSACDSQESIAIAQKIEQINGLYNLRTITEYFLAWQLAIAQHMRQPLL